MKKHGGYFGDDRKNIIDFSVNINPLGVPISLKEKLKASIDNLVDYPEIDGEKGKQALSDKLSISKDNIILGNGATELIYLFSKTFKPKQVLIVEPTFTEYERSLALNGSSINHFDTLEQDDFKIDLDRLETQIQIIKPDLLVVCNPNNPTGIFTHSCELKPLLDKMKQINGMVFIDESFIDFTDKDSYITLIEDYDIFLLRSMTKIYAVPGLRIGYGLASGTIIEQLNKYKEPWTINSMALESVELLLNDLDYKRKTEEWYKKEKEQLKTELKNISELKVYDSEANFFLCKLKNASSKVLRDYLENKGIYIRTCEDFHGLDDSFIRLAVRTREENTILLKELRQYFKVNTV